MPNYVQNKITLHGNNDTVALVAEMVRRFNEDRKKMKGKDDGGALGRVLYGMSGEEAHLSYEKTGSRLVFMDDYIKDGKTFNFQSSWEPLHKLQDYILKYASTIDPSVVVINTSIEEGSAFYGCRIITCEDGEFQEFGFREDSTHLYIADELDREGFDPSLHYTWDEFYQMIEDKKMDEVLNLIRHTHSVEIEYFKG